MKHNFPSTDTIDISNYTQCLMIGSGPSIDQYKTLSDFPHYTDNTLVITVNYAPLRFTAHYNWAMDSQVLKKLLTVPKPISTKYIFLENAAYPHRLTAFEYDKCPSIIDYSYDSTVPWYTNFTLSTAMKFIVYTKPMPIFLYGADGSNAGVKWYHSYNVDSHGKNVQQKTFDMWEKGLEDMPFKELVLNCNPQSKYTLFKKVS